MAPYLFVLFVRTFYDAKYSTKFTRYLNFMHHHSTVQYCRGLIRNKSHIYSTEFHCTND
jgi:hypothetical protein